MHKNLAHIGRIATNPHLRRMANVLAHYPIGSAIDEEALAATLGLDKDTTTFLLDTLHEVGCLRPNTPPAAALPVAA